MPERNLPRELHEQLADIQERLRWLDAFGSSFASATVTGAGGIGPHAHDGTDGSGELELGSPASSLFGEGGDDGSSILAAAADHEHSRRTDFVWNWAQVGP